MSSSDLLMDIFQDLGLLPENVERQKKVFEQVCAWESLLRDEIKTEMRMEFDIIFENKLAQTNVTNVTKNDTKKSAIDNIFDSQLNVSQDDEFSINIDLADYGCDDKTPVVNKGSGFNNDPPNEPGQRGSNEFLLNCGERELPEVSSTEVPESLLSNPLFQKVSGIKTSADSTNDSICDHPLYKKLVEYSGESAISELTPEENEAEDIEKMWAEKLNY